MFIKRYKFIFVLLLLVLFVALFLGSSNSLEGFETGYSKIQSADVDLQLSLDALINIKKGPNNYLLSMKLALPSEDSFSNHSADLKTYIQSLSKLKDHVANIKNKKSASGRRVNYSIQLVNAAGIVISNIDLLLKAVSEFKHDLPDEMKTIIDDLMNSCRKLIQFVKTPVLYSINNTTTTCKSNECKSADQIRNILMRLVLPVVDYDNKYADGISNTQKLVLTTADLGTDNSTLQDYLTNIDNFAAFINKLDSDPMIPDKKLELLVFTTDIRTKLNNLKQYIDNYNPDESLKLEVSANPGVSANPLVSANP